MMGKMSVHKTIRDGRIRLQMTEQQFADALDVSRGTVQQWEKEDAAGGTAPSRKRQSSVARLLGISVADLMQQDGHATGSIAPLSLSGNTVSKSPATPVQQAPEAIKSEAQNVNLDYLAAQITDPVLRAEAVRDAVAIILTAIRKQKSSPLQEVAQTHGTPAE